MNAHELAYILNANHLDALPTLSRANPTTAQLLGLPADTDLQAWAADTYNRPVFMERKAELHNLFAELTKATGHWTPRTFKFQYDPQDAYDFVAEDYDQCAECSAIIPKGDVCHECGSTNHQPVDMNTEQARMAVEDHDAQNHEFFLDHLADYAARAYNRGFTTMFISGTNLGWQKRSGYTHCAPETTPLQNALELNCDHSLYCTWNRETDELHVLRFHHDAPTGEHIEVKPAHLCERTGEPLIDAGNYAAHAAHLCDSAPTHLSWDGFIDLVYYYYAPLAALFNAVGADLTPEAVRIAVELFEELP